MTVTAPITRTDNRYLTGNFAPVSEELTATDLEVTGTLPAHLDGRYLRIGPNPLHDPGQRYHWFLGEGMVHGVRLRGGQAQWYRNRWVRSAGVAAELGEPVRGTPPERDFAANTNVLGHAGRTFALVEAGSPPYELTDELDTVGACDFGGTLPGGYTAHPHEDPETGELHAVSYSWTRGNRVDYSVLDTGGRVRRSVAVEVNGSPMIHDCALTGVVRRGARPARHLRHRPGHRGRAAAGAAVRRPGDEPRDRPQPAARADRRPDGARRREGPGRAALLVGPRLPGADRPAPPRQRRRVGRAVVRDRPLLHLPHPQRLRGRGSRRQRGDRRGQAPADVRDRLHRTQRGAGGAHPLHPRPAHRRASPSAGSTSARRSSRATTSVVPAAPTATATASGFADAVLGDSVLKHDLDAGTTTERRLGAGRETSEFCFVPHPGSTGEDDGVLLGYVFDRDRGTSDLRVLDAQTLDDVAAVHLPGRVPAGFHGNWAPAEG